MELEQVEAGVQHPNKMKFRGVLVRLDEASTKPPNGSGGHKIMVSTDVAKRRLGTLIGMGLNYSPDLDTHAQRRKVGVIDKAWIDGKDLKVEGHIWKHDFPEAEKDLKQSGLGMSMELGDVRVDNPHADVWALDDFQFLGATILWRDSAAYNRTQAIAARAEQRREGMDKTRTRSTARASQGEKLAQIAAEAAAGAVRKGSKQVLAALKSTTEALSGIAAQQEELSSRLAAVETGTTITAAGSEDDVDAAGDAASSSSTSSEMETRRVKAAKKAAPSSSSSSTSSEEGDLETRRVKAAKKTSSSSSTSSEGNEDEFESSVDTGDLEENEKDEDDAGHANEDAKNRGHDGADDLIKKVGKTVESARIHALRKENKQLRAQLAAQVQASNKRVRKLESRFDKIQNQVTAASDRTSRRSLPPEVTTLLAKANIEAGDLYRTGTKMSVAEIDGILASSGVNLAPQDRMAIKNSLLKEGLMDEGRVERNAR
jgi:DNA-binding transcriptional regulator YiaG